MFDKVAILIGILWVLLSSRDETVFFPFRSYQNELLIELSEWRLALMIAKAAILITHFFHERNTHLLLAN